jgi:large subunit ribosomal protein L21
VSVSNALTFNGNFCKLILKLFITSSNQGKINMFAVVDVVGQQLKVSPSERVYIPKLSEKIGSTVKFNRVLLVADDKDIKIGNPFVSNVTVEAKVLGHVKDDTVIVFKKKKRKGYRLRRGHRQQYTEVEITSIG